MSLWYLDRAAGLVTLALLTASVAVGLVTALRVHTERWPRFAIADLHRNIGLLALVFGAVHALSSVLDGYVDLRLADAIVPFGSTYKPFAVGIGALAADLMLAVLITSGLRRRLGHKAWRAVHWLAYGAWGFGLLHALVIGSDTRAAPVLVAVCTGAGAVGGLGSMRYSAARQRSVRLSAARP